MRFRLFASGLALVIALAQVSPVVGQQRAEGSREWSVVQKIVEGEKIVVRTLAGDKVEGRFKSATDTSIVILRDGKDFSIARDDIRRVSHKGGKSRSTAALIGAGIGGGGGALVSGPIYKAGGGDFADEFVPVSILLGAGIGAGIGALLGKGKKDITIYEAP